VAFSSLALLLEEDAVRVVVVVVVVVGKLKLGFVFTGHVSGSFAVTSSVLKLSHVQQ
jgi:hypothetical protein